MTEPGPDAPISLAEAAQRLGISYDAARRRIARGTLPAVKVGDRWFVAAPDAGPVPDDLPNTQPDPRPEVEPNATGSTPDAMPARAAADQELIDTLHATVADLRTRLDAEREARRMVDARVQELEDGLLCVAGSLSAQTRELSPTVVDVQNVPQEHAIAPQSDVAPERTYDLFRETSANPEPLKPSANTLALGWRRWWRRITGK